MGALVNTKREYGASHDYTPKTINFVVCEMETGGGYETLNPLIFLTDICSDGIVTSEAFEFSNDPNVSYIVIGYTTMFDMKDYHFTPIGGGIVNIAVDANDYGDGFIYYPDPTPTQIIRGGEATPDPRNNREEETPTRAGGAIPTSVMVYEYSSGQWKDQLTSTTTYTVDSTGGYLNPNPTVQTYAYDASGNPTNYQGKALVWEGKRLASITSGNTTTAFSYDESGIRTEKRTGNTATQYYYNGSLLMGLAKGTYSGATFTASEAMYFSYDTVAQVVSVSYSTNPNAGSPVYTEYYYLRNGQGDIIGLLNAGGAKVVEYAYDTWGKAISTTGSLAGTLGALNPFRYRGYVYDSETQLYYLKSRYYDASIGRFISADALLSTGQGVLGYNMYAYCNNNPICYKDLQGTKAGDVFETPDQAAKDFARTYNKESIEAKEEYGSMIYAVRVWNVTFYDAKLDAFVFYETAIVYTYNKPAVGKGGASVTPNLSTDIDMDVEHAAAFTVVASVHTHANYDSRYDNENFSDGKFTSDLAMSRLFRMNSYVVTPGGTLKKYTFANRNDATGGITVLCTDIYRDPNCPYMYV